MNNKSLIIYKSKTGFTERFAEWICEELSCDMISYKENFTDEEWAKIKVFYMQSGLCYEKMGIGDKLMMAIFSLVEYCSNERKSV